MESAYGMDISPFNKHVITDFTYILSGNRNIFLLVALRICWNSAFFWDLGNYNGPFLRESYMKQERRELWKLFPTQCYWNLAWYQWRQSFCDGINYLGTDFCLCASWEPHFTMPCTSSMHWQKPDFPTGCLTILAWLLFKCWLGAGSFVAFSILLAWTLLRHQLRALFLKPAVSIC